MKLLLPFLLAFGLYAHDAKGKSHAPASAKKTPICASCGQSITKAAADAVLLRSPVKGATVKVGEFVGKVFWRGVTQYRSAFSARSESFSTCSCSLAIDVQK